MDENSQVDTCENVASDMHIRVQKQVPQIHARKSCSITGKNNTFKLLETKGKRKFSYNNLNSYKQC